MATVRYTTVNGEVIAEKRNGVRSLYVPDALGSTVALLDNTQTKIDTFEYWPYGETRTRTGTTPTPLQYVGTAGYYRQNSQMTYARHRFLDVTSGRWNSQRQSSNMRGGNAYVFVPPAPAPRSGGYAASPGPRPAKLYQPPGPRTGPKPYYPPWPGYSLDPTVTFPYLPRYSGPEPDPHIRTEPTPDCLGLKGDPACFCEQLSMFFRWYNGAVGAYNDCIDAKKFTERECYDKFDAKYRFYYSALVALLKNNCHCKFNDPPIWPYQRLVGDQTIT